MNNEIKILIADDDREMRNDLYENLKDFMDNSPELNLKLHIDIADSFQKALAKLNESERNSSYYQIYFADINFSENKGGERDTGYKVIENAFNICPLTKIVTFSAHFDDKDLWPKWQELEKRGMIALGLKKSHREGGEQSWYFENFMKIFGEIKEELIFWEMWLNHKMIEHTLKTVKLSNDQIENMLLTGTINFNLEACLTLIKQLNKINEKSIILHLIIYLYHLSLEQFCKGYNTDDEIRKRSETNLGLAKKIIPIDHIDHFSPDKRLSAIQVLISFTVDERLKFGDKLNFYRNNSIHPELISKSKLDNQPMPKMEFKIEFGNIVFANLVLTLYIAGKDNVHFKQIKGALENLEITGQSTKHLNELIKYLEI